MKAISLWQPWASLMALGHKKNETRGKYTEYRGPLAIQAAKRIVIPNDPQFINALQDLGLLDQEFPQGVIVGICDLVEVERIGSHFPVNGYEYLFGNYTVGRYAWITENMRKVDPPIPCRGYQWLFDWEPPPAEPSPEERFRKYLDYIKNTGGSPEIRWFDDDWEPIGPLVRKEMREAGLIIEDFGMIHVCERLPTDLEIRAQKRLLGL